MICPSCNTFPVKRLEVICEACRSVNPEHIKPIVGRVMDDIEKDAA